MRCIWSKLPKCEYSRMHNFVVWGSEIAQLHASQTKIWKELQTMKCAVWRPTNCAISEPHTTKLCIREYSFCCDLVATREMRFLRPFYAGVSTRFGLRSIEQSIENQLFIFCSLLQNLRLWTTNCLVSTLDAMRCM